MGNPMNELMALRIKHDLSPSLAKILILLAKNQIVTAEMIEVEEELATEAKVAIHRLRRELEGSGIEVQSRRGIGYWVDSEARKLITEAMIPPQMELPFGDEGDGEDGGDSGSDAGGPSTST